MEIYTIEVGMNLTNSYIVNDKKFSFLIDPGDDGERILSLIKDKELDIKSIVLTHGHFDHIGAVEFLKKELKVELCIHKDDNIYLADKKKNLSYFKGIEISLETADILLKEGDNIGGFRVLSTPGHTPGGISLYNQEEGILFSGDLIFRNAYGRTDLPGGDQNILFSSLEKIIQLPAETLVYPGHGPTTTIGEFKKYIS